MREKLHMRRIKRDIATDDRFNRALIFCVTLLLLCKRLRACLNNRKQSNFGHIRKGFLAFLSSSAAHLWDFYRTRYPLD